MRHILYAILQVQVTALSAIHVKTNCYIMLKLHLLTYFQGCVSDQWLHMFSLHLLWFTLS